MPTPLIILKGKRFGTFTVVEREMRRGAKIARWRCDCDCGATRILEARHLKPSYKPECVCHVKQAEPSNEVAIAYEKLVGRMATVTGVSESVIRGRSRDKIPTAIRRVICRALRDEKFSLPQIGRAAKRHHACVIRMLDDPDPMGRLARLLGQEDARSFRETVSRWRDQLVTEVKQAVAPVDQDRAMFDRAVQTLTTIPLERRQIVWEETCRIIFPHSWRSQAAAMPRGVEAA